MIIQDNALALTGENTHLQIWKYDLLDNSFTNEHLRFHVMRVSAYKS